MKSVAIIGARGIGKHHANWWRLAGVEVRAFAGTSVVSVQETAAALEKMFGIKAAGHVSVEAMLAAGPYDFVDVCSPNALHARHVRQALEADAHVLCEKPFVHDLQHSAAQLLAEADALLALAATRERQLGLCSQYAVFAASCLREFSKSRPGEVVTEFAGEIASPAKGRAPDARDTWLDLGPHLLAALQAAVPGMAEDLGGLRVAVSGDRLEATFAAAGARPVACRLCTHRVPDGGTHVRRLLINGAAFDLGGYKGADGIYGAQVKSPLGDWQEEDPMRVLIRQMAAGCPVLDGAAARRNLAWLLQVLGTI